MRSSPARCCRSFPADNTARSARGTRSDCGWWSSSSPAFRSSAMSPTEFSASATARSRPALIGGAYSSTAVTQALAQRLGSDSKARRRTGRHRASRRPSCTCGPGPDRDPCDARAVPIAVLLAPAMSSPGLPASGSIERHPATTGRRRPATRSPCCPRSASSPSSQLPPLPQNGPRGASGRAALPFSC